jgi:DNA processing protein
LGDPKKYWVGFNLVKGIGAVRFKNLLNKFGDASNAWNATQEELKAAGISPKILENFLQVRRGVSLDYVWEQIQAGGIDVLTWDDDEYPARLREIDQSPPVIYIRGAITPEDDWAVSIVGTRRTTAYGRQVAENISRVLAQNGVTIVSGMARGVDAIAHKASLDVGGRTLAVLGSGVDRIYPPEHRSLAERIMQNGAIISDYPPGTPPEGVNFPPRNRIISGLTLAVIVVEAGERSGALITAGFAADQGREVFAVPGNINAPQSKGTNRLIHQGARPLLDAKEVLEHLDLTSITQYRAARAVLPADATEARLLELVSQEPLHVDEIRNQTDLPIEIVSATLALMELKGMVRQVGGMQYVAVRETGEGYEVNDV